jgi:hypothetical protein
LYWNLANVACPEPKREEDRSLAATGFDLGQENVDTLTTLPIVTISDKTTQHNKTHRSEYLQLAANLKNIYKQTY